jgi:CheY-like chemotaxis protein
MARILVVEDNPQNLKLVSVLLRSAGHEVVPALDAEEAEKAIGKALPDLILMDLGLPGKDGYSLTRELRERPGTSHLPILAVTSFAMKGDEQRAMEAGCTSYLTKPVDRVTLLDRVAQLLGPTPSANPAAASGPPVAVGRPQPP